MDQYPVDHTALTTADSGIRQATQGICLHTSEGSLSVPGLLAFCQNPDNGASYNTMIDRAGVTGRSNDDDYAPWAAGWTGNARLFHICLLGFSRQSRDEWLSYGGQIDRCADMVAHYCRKYGIPTVRLTGPQLRAAQRGICGHGDVSDAWHEVDHWDPGPNFPYDVLLSKVNAKLNPAPPAPPKGDDMTPEQDKLLRYVAEQLGPWRQLGVNDKGQPLTLVDAVAELKRDRDKGAGA